MDPRLSFEETWFNVARALADGRADCTRRKVSAWILTMDWRVVSAGYNGAPPGEPGCLSAGACPRGRHYEVYRYTLPPFEPASRYYYGSVYRSCACSIQVHGDCPDAVAPGSSYDSGPGMCIGVHAEQNAIADAAVRGVSVRGCQMLVTDEPCTGCTRLIRGARLVSVKWPEGSIQF